jgi:hypothetical protein
MEFDVPGGSLVSDEGHALRLYGNHDNVIHRALAEVEDRDEIYVSFLFRFQGAVEDNDYVGLWFDSVATGTHPDVPSLGFKANHGTGAGTSDLYARTRIGQETFVEDVIPGESYFIVGRVSKDVAGPLQPYNRLDLWVNPAYTDQLSPDGTATGDSIASFTRVGVRIPLFEIDDTAHLARLVLGETWDDVVPPPAVAGTAFLRADSNADGAVNLTDAVFALNYLFVGGPEPSCLDAADADDNGDVTITDAVFTLNGLFVGGPQPPSPGTASCGLDPSDDDLDCATFPSCP